jgi:hypothetical protein
MGKEKFCNGNLDVDGRMLTRSSEKNSLLFLIYDTDRKENENRADRHREDGNFTINFFVSKEGK